VNAPSGEASRPAAVPPPLPNTADDEAHQAQAADESSESASNEATELGSDEEKEES
jgi:hypothetical protein